MENKTITEWFLTREALLNSDHINWSQKVFIKEGFYIPDGKSGGIDLNDVLIEYAEFIKVPRELHECLMTTVSEFFNGTSTTALVDLQIFGGWRGKFIHLNVGLYEGYVIHFFKILHNEGYFPKVKWSTWMKFVEGVPELVEYMNKKAYPY